MNQLEKEAYLREYSILKSQGKPFFPYAIAKDSWMAVVVMITIITMSIVLGAELGPKVDPTTTTYVPRPEWYFYFLFEVLRIIKPPSLVPLAAIGVPTICMILLFLLPFYDRSPERRPERRPIAMAAAFFTIAAMAFLTYEGAIAWRARRPPIADRFGPRVPPLWPILWQAKQPDCATTCLPASHWRSVCGPAAITLAGASMSIWFGEPALAPS